MDPPHSPHHSPVATMAVQLPPAPLPLACVCGWPSAALLVAVPWVCISRCGCEASQGRRTLRAASRACCCAACWRCALLRLVLFVVEAASALPSPLDPSPCPTVAAGNGVAWGAWESVCVAGGGADVVRALHIVEDSSRVVVRAAWRRRTCGVCACVCVSMCACVCVNLCV
jgi:hypothetical protein